MGGRPGGMAVEWFLLLELLSAQYKVAHPSHTLRANLDFLAARLVQIRTTRKINLIGCFPWKKGGLINHDSLDRMQRVCAPNAACARVHGRFNLQVRTGCYGPILLPFSHPSLL